MDLMSRKILAHIAQDAGCDVEAVARAVGCTSDVAADRIRRLREDGIVTGFHAHVDLSNVGSHHEALVVGVPSHATDAGELRRLSQERDVSRVYTLASQASIAFHVHGSDPEGLEKRAAELAQQAGLVAHRCTLVITSLEGPAQAPLVPITA